MSCLLNTLASLIRRVQVSRDFKCKSIGKSISQVEIVERIGIYYVNTRLNISIRLFGQNGWRVVAIYFRFFLLGTTLLNNNDWTIDADDVILNRCGCVKWFNQIFCYPGKYVPTSTFKVKDSIVVIIPCGCLYSLYRDWSLEMVKEANIM